MSMKEHRPRGGDPTLTSAPRVPSGSRDGALACGSQDTLGNSALAERLGVPPSVDGQAGARAPTAASDLAAQDPGIALPYKAEMEAVFGEDFSDVLVTAGPGSAAASAALGAEAFVIGDHIAFSDDRPSRAVVAHELAHIIQQTRPRAPASDPPAASSTEAEADAAAEAVVAGEQPEVGLRSGVGVARWKGPGHRKSGDKAMKAARRRRPNVWKNKLNDGRVSVKRDGKKRELGFGEATRQAGDRYETYHSFVDGPKPEEAKDNKTEKNTRHNFILNREEWAAYHKEAIVHAKKARKDYTNDGDGSQNANKALRLESFGAHFMQDAFASGHINPRALDYFAKKHDTLGWRKDTVGRKRRGKTYHDAFNNQGMYVTSGAGTNFKTYGDGKYDDSEESRKLLKALQFDSLNALATTVETGHPDKKTSELKDRFPKPNFDKMEGITADDDDWKMGALWQMMVWDYRDEHATMSGLSGRKRGERVQSKSGAKGPKSSVDDILDDPSMERMFDVGDKESQWEHINENLRYLGKILEPVGSNDPRTKKSKNRSDQMIQTIYRQLVHLKKEPGVILSAFHADLLTMCSPGGVLRAAGLKGRKERVAKLIAGIPGSNMQTTGGQSSAGDLP